MQSNHLAYKKRLLAILTSLTLIFTMSFSTITAFAAEEDQLVETEYEQQIEEGTSDDTNINDTDESTSDIDVIAEENTGEENEEESGEETSSSELNGGSVVKQSGEYILAEGATGTITINDGVKATLIGNNYDAATNSFSNAYIDLNIVVGAEAELTIQDLYVDVSEDSKPIIDFQGKGKLIVTGHNLLDRPDGYGSDATIHVGPDADVTFDGDGYLWGYKHAAGSYIGSNANEVCGNVTFNGGTYLLKASKTGALIGQDGTAPATGKITINGGTIYLKAVARGSLLGASAQGKAPDVEINGGQIEFVTDWSGAAIGSATPANAGNLTVNGGSIRTIVTQNAYSAWGIDASTNKGAVLSDNNITAAHDTKMLAFDATKYVDADKISVYVDGGETPFYEGGLYEFCTNEVKNPTTPYANSTMCNWLPNTDEFKLTEESEYTGAYPTSDGSQLAGDNTLVFQLSKENHILTVNGDEYFALYDEEAGTFDTLMKVEAKEATCEEAGNIEYWTNADNSIYVIFEEDGTAKTVTAEDITIAAGHKYGEDGICTVCGKIGPDVEKFTVKEKSDLEKVAEAVNEGNTLAGVVVTLENDIDLGSEEWTPIGDQSHAFAGTFDGAGHTISGLLIGRTTGYAALFGNNSGTVKDLTVKGQYGSADAKLSVKGDCFAGAVAYNTGTVDGVVNEVSMYLTGGDTYAVGGVVGRNNGGTVSKCGNEGQISCDTAKSFYRVGGVVGHLQGNGVITECYNHADVEAWNYRNGCQGVGGILGSLDTNGDVTYCYNTGMVHNGKGDSDTGGKHGTGGIVGAINAGNVSYCYATANTYGPASTGVLIGKLGNGTYDNLYYLNTARGYQQYGTQTDPENNLKYCDGKDENPDGSLKYGGAGLANSYNTGYTISNSYTMAYEDMIAPAFAETLSDKFQASCGFPVLSWEETTAHVEGAAQDTDTVAATFDEGDYHYSVTVCTECGLELSRSEKIYTSDSLSKQAEDAIAAAEEAQKTADELAEAAATATGEDALEAAQKALDAAATAKQAAQAAQKAAQKAQAAATDEQQEAAAALVDEAAAAVQTADEAVEKAAEATDDALAETNSIKEAKDAATVSMATLDSTVKKALYTTATYDVYAGAIKDFKALVKDTSATKQQIIDARADITKAYASLELKAANTLTVKAKTAKVKYKKLKKKNQTVAGAKVLTVSKNIGKVTYAKASGNSKISINASNGKVTVKKKLKKGTYSVKVKVTAAGNGNYLAGTKTVTFKVKVK